MSPKKSKRFSNISCVLIVIMSICCLSIITLVNSDESSSDPTKPTKQVIISSSEPTQIIIKPTQSIAENLYNELVDRLDNRIIKGVQLSGRDLIIQTKLTRSDIEWFYEDIGAIHGVVMRENPDVDRVIINDITGQQIIIPISSMKDFYQKIIDWDTFRSTWTVINP